MKKVHLVGVAGTGMGQLAVLFREAGYEVRGSDTAFDPPVGPELRRHGIVTLDAGYRAENLDWGPDLVVIGNVIRKDNPESLAAEQRGLARVSMSGALRQEFLRGRRSVVITGTHGKTTTSAMMSHVLHAAELAPGWFVGGLPKTLPAGASVGRVRRALPTQGSNLPARAPFVLEGDEYDDVYWSKQPKFLDYVGVSPDDVVVLTSVEQDHVDLYADLAAYEAAFEKLIAAIPEQGLLIAYAGDPAVRRLAEASKARIVYYALEGDDTGEATPTWLGAPAVVEDGRQLFDLYAGGVSVGRFALPLVGQHNVKNALAVLAVAAEAFHVPWKTLRQALSTFEGVKRRQDLYAAPRGIRLYDDFAHHPTAVEETLRALRSKHPQGKLFAVFEPRSATACRNLHQQAYPPSFRAADRVILAPLGRANVAEADRLDLPRLVTEVGEKATLARDVPHILDTIVTEARPGDTVAILSNGAFGGLHARLAAALEGPS